MTRSNGFSLATVPRDLTAGLVVFLVALPLCLGVALASKAPLLSGVLAGIVGGTLVAMISGSQSSVSGPAAGLTTVVVAQVTALGSFEAFLMALVLAGVIQIALGVARGGFIAAFVPTGVIKGLLAAIGVILILKQIPHVLGYDADVEGDMAFQQPDQRNTFSELWETLGNIHPGAAALGLVSIALLVLWDRYKPLKKSIVPAPLVVVLLGVAVSHWYRQLGGAWVIEPSHLVQVPISASLSHFFESLSSPDFTQWSNPQIYLSAVTIAAVASLETLLNLDAVDKIDPEQRTSPPSRELVAQGIGNLVVGLVGGLPITSVIVRSSVNINAGGKTRLSAIVHGLLLLVSVLFFPVWINLIPLSCLAAILLVTGFKLASPTLVREMWKEGRYQFIPFAVTVAAIVLTDLLVGILIGLAVSTGFILNSSLRRPIRRVVEKHLGGDVLHIELANQVSFLNRAALSGVLDAVPRGSQVLLDAQNTDYIDPDVLALIRDFKDKAAPARGVQISTLGFQSKYQLRDDVQYVDYSTRDLQSKLTPEQVLKILKDGHERYCTGQRLTRDLARQRSATADGQHALAVVLSCIDSRTPAESIFDLGVGDILSVRIAGNIAGQKVLGSVEYGCARAGAKLILVLGHTRCGAVTAAVDLIGQSESATEDGDCEHLGPILHEIQRAIGPATRDEIELMNPRDKESFVTAVARRNVLRTAEALLHQSKTIARLVELGQIAIVGALYDVVSGKIEFLDPRADA